MNHSLSVCCIVLAVFIISVLNPVQAELTADDITGVIKNCAAEFKITDEEIAKVKVADKLKYEASDDLKCFTKCTTEKLGFVTDNKTVNIDRVIEIYKAKGQDHIDAKKSAEKCQELFKGDLDCQLAWDMYVCFTKNEKPTETPTEKTD